MGDLWSSFLVGISLVFTERRTKRNFSQVYQSCIIAGDVGRQLAVILFVKKKSSKVNRCGNKNGSIRCGSCGRLPNGFGKKFYQRFHHRTDTQAEYDWNRFVRIGIYFTGNCNAFSFEKRAGG